MVVSLGVNHQTAANRPLTVTPRASPAKSSSLALDSLQHRHSQPKEERDQAAAKLRAQMQGKTFILDFQIKLDQPLGMKINHVEDHNMWPAEITTVVEGGQAETAGVVAGMYVVAVNGTTTQGLTLDDVVQCVIRAKMEKTPLTLKLQFIPVNTPS